MLALSTRRKLFYDDDYKPLQNENSKGRARQPNEKPLKALMNCDDELFVDFIDKCLEWKPDKRLKPIEAFNHAWIKNGILELKQKVEEGERV